MFQLYLFQQDLDTSRLFASGVSVTIVEKSKSSTDDSSTTTKAAASKETSSKESPKVATEIGLGSDISVTLVQKKKTDSAPVGSGEIGSIAVAAAAARIPKISVKKESELLQDPSAAKDIVQVVLTKESDPKNGILN
jgi:hypothetical protein